MFRLYGEWVVDYALAASQGYFNIQQQKWDQGILRDLLGLGQERFSPVAESTHRLRNMRRQLASELGIDPALPLAIGSGDGIMAHFGSGAGQGQALSSTIGTSGAIRMAVDRPLLDPDGRTWCYSFTNDIWVAGGAINNGALVLQWIEREFGAAYRGADSDETEGELFSRLAASIPAGSDGLLFWPHLTGERSPDWNAGARGLIYGLNLTHGRNHLIRAAMEGILYRLYGVYETFAQWNGAGQWIIANGGYANSTPWLQMQADIFNRKVRVSGVQEASALGAALVAMVALGEVPSFQTMLPGMQPRAEIEPNPEQVGAYREAYTRATALYSKVYG